ncbi:MAG: hypothetical protein V1903_13260 [Bacteroidota bacterium]
MKKTGSCITLIILFLTGSCARIQQLPPEPFIEYRDFTVFDTLDILGNFCKGGRLKFYFEDGDGNLGLASPEDTGLDTTNLFFTLYRKTNGEMVQVPDDDNLKPSSYRIPYMDREGQNKILKGTINITFIYLFYEPADSNIVMYEFWLKDRADNFSNTILTTEIPLSVNGTY